MLSKALQHGFLFIIIPDSSLNIQLWSLTPLKYVEIPSVLIPATKDHNSYSYFIEEKAEAGGSWFA